MTRLDSVESYFIGVSRCVYENQKRRLSQVGSVAVLERAWITQALAFLPSPAKERMLAMDSFDLPMSHSKRLA